MVVQRSVSKEASPPHPSKLFFLSTVRLFCSGLNLFQAYVTIVDSDTHGTEDANPQELGATVIAVTDDFTNATIHADSANTIRWILLGRRQV